ncbi:SLC13 family permease [Nocardioides sp.]|uniref:SLC13 family permease n=1 Tax=Nocardioides sp. TaxID=35761 RepID=UPI00351783F8
MGIPLGGVSTAATDTLAGLLLAALLTVAVRPPGRRVEAAVATGAAALALGLLPGALVADTLERLGPVVAFLVAILVVATVADRSGLFVAAGRWVRSSRGGRRGAVRQFGVAFALAGVVTAVLSLDATVVLLTPVVLAATRAAGRSHRPAVYACLRLANSGSLLLPVSNLTTLLALPFLSPGLRDFGTFAAITAPVTAAILAVEYVALRWCLRAEFARPAVVTAGPAPGTVREDAPWPPVPSLGVAAMLLGFVVTGPLGVDPAWVAGVAALVLALWARHRGLLTPGETVAAAQPSFALVVLALGLVVALVAQGPLGRATARLVPTTLGDDDAARFLAALGIAALATVLACLLTNLSATLLLVPLVAPLGDTAVLAALIGLNAGAGLLVSGSLANLLWQRTLAGLGVPESARALHRVSLVATPPAVFAGVLVLIWLT